MAESETEIANMALSHLNVGETILDLTTEQSDVARACRRHYQTVRDATLRDAPWPFATRFASLTPVATNPTIEWGFSYRYFPDAWFIRRILSGLRNDNQDSRVPFRIGSDSAGQLVYTDAQNAQAEYTVKVTDPTLFPPDFTLALSYRLATAIASEVTAGDPTGLRKTCFQLYIAELSKARANAANEEQLDRPPDAESIRERL